MSNFNYYKSFILEHVDKDSDILPLNFYSDLNSGKYIGLKFIILNGSYMFLVNINLKADFTNMVYFVIRQVKTSSLFYFLVIIV